MTGYRPLFLAILLLLSGCSGLRQTPPPPATGPDQSWLLQGKLGLWGEGVQESANLNWRQCPPQFRIRLSGPLGSSAAVITGSDTAVTLERSGEETLRAESPEALAEKLGWPLPVSSLQYWVLGRPVPHEPYRGLQDSNGRVIEMMQRGWGLRFTYTQDNPGGPPRQIELTDGQWRIKVIIRDWLMDPEACLHE